MAQSCRKKSPASLSSLRIYVGCFISIVLFQFLHSLWVLAKIFDPWLEKFSKSEFKQVKSRNKRYAELPNGMLPINFIKQGDKEQRIQPFNFSMPRPFPRWGKEGISIHRLMEFIHGITQPDSHPHTTTIRWPSLRKSLPEIVYIVDSAGVWVSHTLRMSGEMPYIRNRIAPTEDSMWRAWNILSRSSNNDPRWPRLKELTTNTKGGTMATGVPFLAWYGDYQDCNKNNWQKRNATLPIFTVCGRIDCQYAFPMPTYKTITQSQASMEDWDRIMANYSTFYPWNSKIRKVVWRGALTGNIKNYTSARARIGKFRTSNRAKHLFDVGLVKLPHRHRDKEVNLTAIGGLVDPISPMENFQQYFAILDIDGNSWSSRFGGLLCYNSVILKVEPSYVDYFHFKYLQPWKHYVPVRDDLSDLEDIAQYIMDSKNDNVIRKIVANANKWCRKHMTHDSLATDLLDIWEKYVNYLDKGSSQWEAIWKKEKKDIISNTFLNMTLLPLRVNGEPIKVMPRRKLSNTALTTKVIKLVV